MKTPFYYANSRDREREFVRIRDKHKCRRCGIEWKEGARRFDVHHAAENMLGKNRIKMVHKYDKENHDKLLTLCHRCHIQLHKIERLSQTRAIDIANSVIPTFQ